MDPGKLRHLIEQAGERAKRAEDKASDAVSRSTFLYSLSDYYRRVRPTVDSLGRKALETATDALALYPVLVAERVNLFWRGGWTAAAHMNLGNNELDLWQMQSLLAELADEPAETVKDVLDERVPAHFRENDYAKLQELVQSWRSTPAFTARQTIFEEALGAHTEGRYTSAVHLLVPHVEGIFRDITGQTSPGGRTKWLNKVDKALDFNREKGGRWMSDPARAVEEFRKLDKRSRFKQMWQLDTEAALLSFDELYEKRGSDSSYRNRVSHGRVTLCTELDSIRIFCLLDQLSRVARWYSQHTRKQLKVRG